MVKEHSIEDKEQVFLDVIDRMKRYTAPSIVQVCGNFDEETGELLGTGTFFELRNSLYLLTAQHVAGELYTVTKNGDRKYAAGLSHSVGNNQRMKWFPNPWITWNPPQDIAVTRLDRMVLEGADCVALKADTLALNSKALDHDDIYFVHGWPGKQSHFTTFFERGVLSRSLPYGGWLETAKLSSFDYSTHFPITYPPDELIDENGKPTTLPDPHGLSGSVLWKTNRNGSGDSWTPEMARVVGLVQGFNHDWKCLVVTRIEYVKGLLLHTLRSDFAYFRWMKRGKPLGEDLDDWLAAEAAVLDLTGSESDIRQGIRVE